jgi:hypothetical protein
MVNDYRDIVWHEHLVFTKSKTVILIPQTYKLQLCHYRSAQVLVYHLTVIDKFDWMKQN